MAVGDPSASEAALASLGLRVLLPLAHTAAAAGYGNNELFTYSDDTTRAYSAALIAEEAASLCVDGSGGPSGEGESRSHHHTATFRDRAAIVYCDWATDSDDEEKEGMAAEGSPLCRGLQSADSYMFEGAREGLSSADGLNASHAHHTSSHASSAADDAYSPHPSSRIDAGDDDYCSLGRSADFGGTAVYGSKERNERKRRTLLQTEILVETAMPSSTIPTVVLSVRVTEQRRADAKRCAADSAAAQSSSAFHGQSPQSGGGTSVVGVKANKTKVLFEAYQLPLPADVMAFASSSPPSGRRRRDTDDDLATEDPDTSLSSDNLAASLVGALEPFLYLPRGRNHTIGAGGTLHAFLPQGACCCDENNNSVAYGVNCPHTDGCANGTSVSAASLRHQKKSQKVSSRRIAGDGGWVRGPTGTRRFAAPTAETAAMLARASPQPSLRREGGVHAATDGFGSSHVCVNERAFSQEAIIARIGTRGLVIDGECELSLWRRGQRAAIHNNLYAVDCVNMAEGKEEGGTFTADDYESPRRGFTPLALLEAQTASPSLRRRLGDRHLWPDEKRESLFESLFFAPLGDSSIRSAVTASAAAAGSDSYFAADGREPLAIFVCDGSRDAVNAIVAEAMAIAAGAGEGASSF